MDFWSALVLFHINCGRINGIIRGGVLNLRKLESKLKRHSQVPEDEYTYCKGELDGQA